MRKELEDKKTKMDSFSTFAVSLILFSLSSFQASDGKSSCTCSVLGRRQKIMHVNYGHLLPPRPLLATICVRNL